MITACFAQAVGRRRLATSREGQYQRGSGRGGRHRRWPHPLPRWVAAIRPESNPLSKARSAEETGAALLKQIGVAEEELTPLSRAGPT
jgi:hypothetical protein